ncbi:MAG: alpha/beta hydrolase [Ignavibacteria bacterium]|nr:alpha/beta hydrolase [Ignavibacteria bacterium]
MLISLLHNLVRTSFGRLGIRSKYLELESCRLHYYEFPRVNPGGTVVLVHGLGTSSSTWTKVFPVLIRDHRVIAMDLPGFGYSCLKPGRSFCTVNEHRAALEALADQIVQDRFVLVGHSFGGWIAAQCASNRPEQVVHLILINTAGIYYRGIEELARLFTVKSKADTRRLLDALWYRYPWYFRPFTTAIFRELSRRNLNDVIASIKPNDLLAEELSKLRMPVSVLWGKQDKAISSEAVNALKKYVPSSSIYFLDQCGHVPQLECPEAVKRILTGILSGARHGLG